MKRFFCLLCFLNMFLFSEDGVYQSLLEYRLSHDNEYKNLYLEKEIAENELRKTKNSSIANLELGVSDGLFTISKDKTRSGFSLNPYLNFSLPLYNNTGFRLNMPISKKGDDSINTINFSLFTELYGVSRRQQKLLISLATEKRDKTLKKANMSKSYIEKKLLKDIKELFSSYLTVLDKGIKEVQANISYNQVKVQGYGEASSKMRTSKLALLQAERDMKDAEFSFNTKYRRFLKSCGMEDAFVPSNTVSLEEERKDENDRKQLQIADFLEALSKSMPKDEVISLDSFSKDNYVPIQDARRAYEAGKLKRELQVNPVTLTGEAGFSNSKKTYSTSSLLGTGTVNEQNIIAGINLKIPGAKIMSGFEVPLDSKRRGDIGIKFGFAINPLEIWSYVLDKKNSKMQDDIERLKLEEGIDEFETTFNELKTKKGYLEWQRQMTNEEISIYKQNSEEHAEWFRRGLISGYENMQADLEYKRAVVRELDSRINTSTFNIETSLMFE
ncbi:MAG: hypothetical protein ACTTJ6_03165 [Treponema sp.]